jgi:hypothetical protein
VQHPAQNVAPTHHPPLGCFHVLIHYHQHARSRRPQPEGTRAPFWCQSDDDLENGETDPTLSTLSEVALACGVELSLEQSPLSDPSAAAAARYLLDERSPTDVGFDISRWADRLTRWADGEPLKIVQRAGESSSLLTRRGVHHFSGDASDLRLASAGQASASKWVLSGRSALERAASIDPVTAEDRNLDTLISETPRIIYTDNTHRVSRLLNGLTRVDPGDGNVIVAPYESYLDADIFVDGPIRVVAPIQGLIDAFGLGIGPAIAATEIGSRW